jgi:hypothetical protein
VAAAGLAGLLSKLAYLGEPNSTVRFTRPFLDVVHSFTCIAIAYSMIGGLPHWQPVD